MQEEPADKKPQPEENKDRPADEKDQPKDVLPSGEKKPDTAAKKMRHELTRFSKLPKSIPQSSDELNANRISLIFVLVLRLMQMLRMSKQCVFPHVRLQLTLDERRMLREEF